jgi:hypothetical protein
MPFPRSDEPPAPGIPPGAAHDQPELSVNADYSHIIQIRHPVLSTISDYRLICGEFTTVERWVNFAELGMLYRKAFLEKWILANKYLNTDSYHVVDYDDLLEGPERELAKVIEYITPNRAIDAPAIRAAFEKHPVQARWNIEHFVFASTVPRLEEIIADTWESAKLLVRELLPHAH